LLFFTFIYLKFVNSGYLLALSPPLCAWMGLRVSQWYANLGLPRGLRILTVAGGAAANTLVFVYAPLYCSYASVRGFERELASVVRILPQVAPSRDTLIVGFDSHFLGYRHAGYYLPGYRTVQFPEVQMAQGKRIFTMENRNTSLRSGIDCPALRRFVLFPLPAGDAEYSGYTALVRKRFPPGTLHIVTKEGREFAGGDIAAMGFLFPSH
jgi:hypothetical protein